MANSKIAKTFIRPDGKSDLYLYDMPVMIRQNVCKILMKLEAWKELAFHMGYKLSDIQEIQHATRHTNHTEAEELLSRWEEQNHTVMELFVLLLRDHQFQAMNIMKILVDQHYHQFIPQSLQDIDQDHVNNNEEADVDARRPDERGEDGMSSPGLGLFEGQDLLFGEPGFSNEKFLPCPDFLTTALDSSITKIEYNELCNATENWNHKFMWGKGGFGTVYRGIWKRTHVAIKRIQSHFCEQNSSKTQMKTKLNELKQLNSCRQDNILSLYGYCVNGDELYLVNQLLIGESLEEKLFNRPTNVPPLPWKERFNIALGVASGLKFLHTFMVDKPFIHGDIKPANILIDTFYIPKIANFGLAKEYCFGNEEMEIYKVCGTRPYLPKEFRLLHILSVKVDSYSFGIVLFQLATGLRAFEKQAYMYLVDYIQKRTELGELPELIDRTPENASNAEEIFETIIDLGRKCTETKFEDRLDMVTAYDILEDNFTKYNCQSVDVHFQKR